MDKRLLIAIILVIISSLIINQGKKETGCADSDGGVSKFVKGITSGISAFQGMYTDPTTGDQWADIGNSITAVDACASGGMMKEYFCSSEIEVNYNWVTCTNCSDGKCLDALPPQNPCIDSDGGVMKSVKGTTTSYDINNNPTINIDSCFSSSLIKEWYCKSTYEADWWGDSSCPAGTMCRDGACNLSYPIFLSDKNLYLNNGDFQTFITNANGWVTS